jgi:hypothetical protein
MLDKEGYTHTHTYVVLIDFPRQQLLRERTAVLRSTCIACIVQQQKGIARALRDVLCAQTFRSYMMFWSKVIWVWYLRLSAAVKLNYSVFCLITQCMLVYSRSFGTTYRFHLQRSSCLLDPRMWDREVVPKRRLWNKWRCIITKKTENCALSPEKVCLCF